MDLSRIPAGKNPPWDVNVVVEVPMGSDPVKYEIDKDSGALFVDRFLHTAMHYPCDYGFIPHTSADDGDPVDVCIPNKVPVAAGAVVRVRPVGVLIMEDEEGQDEKIIAVPPTKLCPDFKHVYSLDDIKGFTLQRIAHFFQHYKDLEENKWVQVDRWGDHNEAARMIETALNGDVQKLAS